MGDHHLHCLQLLVLRGDGAHLVGDFIACHRNILAFNAVEGKLQLTIKHINALLPLIFLSQYLLCQLLSRYFRGFYRAHLSPQPEVDFCRLAAKSYENTMTTPPPHTTISPFNTA